MKKPSVLILYHFLYPDDVVSAQHFTDLAEGLERHGWQVEAMPSNRSCRKRGTAYTSYEVRNGISFNRIYRPDWNQSSSLGRLANAAWMILRWSLSAFRKKPDVVIVGTDPILSVLVALPWKLLRPRTKVVHWCFDLYPEAAIADGILARRSWFTRLTQHAVRAAYRRCDLIVDIGPCMRELLSAYHSPARKATIPPWALSEPPHPLGVDVEERERVFGSAKLAVMYSGNFGQAHTYRNTLRVARALRNTDVVFAFSVRGNLVDELRSEITDEDENVRFVDFAPMDRLNARLSAADIHLVSLKESWTGMVVPSKFFGAIAVGRPVLFDGSRESSIAKWIVSYGLGWVVDDDRIDEVATSLVRLADTTDLRQRARSVFDAYHAHFSRETLCKEWHNQLMALMEPA